MYYLTTRIGGGYVLPSSTMEVPVMKWKYPTMTRGVA